MLCVSCKRSFGGWYRLSQILVSNVKIFKHLKIDRNGWKSLPKITLRHQVNEEHHSKKSCCDLVSKTCDIRRLFEIRNSLIVKSTLESRPSSERPRSLVWCCTVSWICDFPGGHSFLQKYGLTTITWLQRGLTSSHMNTVGLIGSTRVCQICRNIQITYLHCMGLEDWTHHHHKDKGRRAMPVFPANVGALFRLLPKTSSQDMFGTKRMTFGRLVSHHVFALAFKKPSTAASDGHRHRLRT